MRAHIRESLRHVAVEKKMDQLGASEHDVFDSVLY